MYGKIAERYLNRLAKKRNVYLNGVPIYDVTKESYFTGIINCILKYYQYQETEPETFAFQDSTGNPHISFMIPKSKLDLERKRSAYKLIADLSFGMLGRTPDFMNAAITAIAANSEVLGSDKYANYAENARNYYNYCKENNLFIGHGAINPQIDRSKTLGEQNNTYAGVRILSQDNKGIYVSGAKMIVTLAPIADELLIFNMPGLKKGDEEFAVAFALSVTESGVKLICRKPLSYKHYSNFDHPIANMFDEIDAYLILDKVHIPWEKVFVFKDISKSNDFYDKTKARNHTGHQGIVRGLSKAELMVGVAIETAEKMGLTSLLNVQEQLGELTSCLELVKGAIILSECESEIDSKGNCNPSIQAIQALRYYFPKWYQRMVTIIQSLAAGSMMAVPHSADFNNDNAVHLRTTLNSSYLNAEERSLLLNLAWDLSGDGFGQRQLVYEIYHAGDPIRIAAAHFNGYEKSKMNQKVLKILKGLV